MAIGLPKLSRMDYGLPVDASATQAKGPTLRIKALIQLATRADSQRIFPQQLRGMWRNRAHWYWCSLTGTTITLSHVCLNRGAIEQPGALVIKAGRC